MIEERLEDSAVPEQTPREEGRSLACEGIVRSRFGERPTQAGARAVARLRFEGGSRVRPSRALSAASGLIAAAVLVAAVLGVGGRAPDSDRAASPRVVRLTGSPVVRTSAGSESPASAGETLAPGVELRTGPEDAVTIAYRDGSSIELAAASTVGIERRGTAKRLVLRRGRISADIAPQPPGEPMTMATPDAEVVVRGTRLLLELVGLATRLEVVVGLVEISSAGGSLLVPGGRAATVRRGEAPVLAERAVAAAPSLPDAPALDREPIEPPPHREAEPPGPLGREPTLFAGEVVRVDAEAAALSVRLQKEDGERTFALSPHTAIVLRGPILDELCPGDRVLLRVSPEGEAVQVHAVLVSRPGVSPPPEHWERPDEFIRRHERWERDTGRGWRSEHGGRPEPKR